VICAILRGVCRKNSRCFSLGGAAPRGDVGADLVAAMGGPGCRQKHFRKSQFLKNQFLNKLSIWRARMFERRLTDMAGGNLSARAGETLYITPRYAGSRQHWQLTAAEILSGPVEGDGLQTPTLLREGQAHLAIYRAFPEVGAVNPRPSLSRFALLCSRTVDRTCAGGDPKNLG
jgi:L-fuculose-phosphate aldolase